jgi:ASC-1-like (ASCH) protein
MKISLESKLLDILSDKEFKQLSDDEKIYVLTSITEEEYSFYKKILKEERIEEILPNKSVKQKLDTVLNNKRNAKNQLYKPLVAAASVILIAIAIWSIPKNDSNVKVLSNAEMNSNTEWHNTEITNVLLKLGRIENQSSKIVPSFNSELESSIAINSKVFL